MSQIKQEGNRAHPPSRGNWFYLMNQAKTKLIKKTNQNNNFIQEYERDEVKEYHTTGKYEGDTKIFRFARFQSQKKKKGLGNFHFLCYADNFLRKVTGELERKKDKKIIIN